MDSMVFGRYIPNDTVIHKLDPRIKIIGLLLLIIALFLPAGWIGYAVIGLVIVDSLYLAKLSFSYVWKAIKPMLIMMVFLAVINGLLLHTGEVAFTIGKISIYWDAIYQTLYIVVRLLYMITLTTILTATTKPLDLTLGIEELLKPFNKVIPAHTIAMMISIALRFIPTLIEETQRIMKAQQSRGVDLDEGKLTEKIMAILSLIVPLFISAFQRAEDLANAMEARGYVPDRPRTRYKQLKLAGRDFRAFLVYTIAFVVVVAAMVML